MAIVDEPNLMMAPPNHRLFLGDLGHEGTDGDRIIATGFVGDVGDEFVDAGINGSGFGFGRIILSSSGS